MLRLPASWSERKKKLTASILALAAIASAFLTMKDFVYQFISSEPDEYVEDWIPLVYEEAVDFRTFLEKNVGKKVVINSAIALDDAIPVNHLIHQICEFNGPNEATQDNKSPPRSFSFGLPRFSADFDEETLNKNVYDEKKESFPISENVFAQVNCLDRIRIEPIEPEIFDGVMEALARVRYH